MPAVESRDPALNAGGGLATEPSGPLQEFPDPNLVFRDPDDSDGGDSEDNPTASLDPRGQDGDAEGFSDEEGSGSEDWEDWEDATGSGVALEGAEEMGDLGYEELTIDFNEEGMPTNPSITLKLSVYNVGCLFW
jgi:hypothetical protein